MSGCTLCDLPVGEDPVTDPEVPGQYCCRGCLAVARTLDEPAAATPEDAVSTSTAEPEEGEVAYLAVDGMHCATCELYLESRATDQAGIVDAAASYATDTMKVVYDPARRSAADLPDLISGAGYTASRRTDGRTPGTGRSVSASFLVSGGFFGMMTMVLYALFVYPQHFGFAPVVAFGAFGRLYLLGQIWLFATVVLFVTGFPILRGALVSLRAGQPNMDLLVGLAATSAYLYSTAVALGGGLGVYFDVTVVIVLVVTAGRYYEDRIKERAVGGLTALTAQRVDTARTTDGATVPVDDLDPGTGVVVRPGERIPVDGTVREGRAAVDEALVTGESLPVTRRPGDEVVGGSLVTDEPLVVDVGPDATSTLDRIVALLWDIQSTRGGAQHLADRLATVFVPVVATLAVVATVVAVLLGSSPTGALLLGLTVLIVSCPCALGLATPLAVARGVQRAADEGAIVTTDAVFEHLPDTAVVALDKTGTLTTGTMTVSEVQAADEATVLRRAAALERYASHPIADAIVEHAGETLETNSRADGGTATGDLPVSVEARGVVGPVAGRETVVGHPDLCAERGWAVPEDLATRAREVEAAGSVPVLVGWEGEARGLIVVADEPRADWRSTVEALAARDRSVVVLTGDDAATGEFDSHPAVAAVFAGVPPEGKAATVERLRERGPVAMVGDGSNDAPALAAADVGVAVARGTAIASDAADAVITGNRLRTVPTLIDVAETTRRRVRQNLGWALLYNVVAIPTAAAGLLNPLVAAVAMGTSSLLVVLNSSRGD